jgi:hypothetical protein
MEITTSSITGNGQQETEIKLWKAFRYDHTESQIRHWHNVSSFRNLAKEKLNFQFSFYWTLGGCNTNGLILPGEGVI